MHRRAAPHPREPSPILAVERQASAHRRAFKNTIITGVITALVLGGVPQQALAGTDATLTTGGSGSTWTNVTNGVDIDPSLGTVGTATNSSGTGNIAIGDSAGWNLSGNNNASLGFSAGDSVSGIANSAFGLNAGDSVTGSFNSGFGNASGFNVTGNYNTGDGFFSGISVIGTGNV